MSVQASGTGIRGWREGARARRRCAPPRDGIAFFRGVLISIPISALFWVGIIKAGAALLH